MDTSIQQLVGKDVTIVKVLEANPVVGREYDTPKLPLYWQSFVDLNLTEQWFKRLVDTAGFQKSDYGINTKKEEIRVYDDRIRQSSIFRKPMPQLNKATKGLLADWAGEPEEFFIPNEQWNVLKYIDGFFAWHKDKVTIIPEYQHLGTQIVFPPLAYNRYEGGDLVVLEANDQEIKLRPLEDQWLYIVLPLGYLHCVEKVHGIRYSFTKEIYFRLKEEDQDVPKEPVPST